MVGVKYIIPQKIIEAILIAGFCKFQTDSTY